MPWLPSRLQNRFRTGSETHSDASFFKRATTSSEKLEGGNAEATTSSENWKEAGTFLRPIACPPPLKLGCGVRYFGERNGA